MLTLAPLIFCLTIFATVITGLPAKDQGKRYIPYKRQNIGNVTTTTIFVGTTSMVGEISTSVFLNQTATIFIGQNTTLEIVPGTATGGNPIPMIPTAGVPMVSQGVNDTIVKRFFNYPQMKLYEPTTTASRARKSFMTISSTVQGSPTARPTLANGVLKRTVIL